MKNKICKYFVFAFSIISFCATAQEQPKELKNEIGINLFYIFDELVRSGDDTTEENFAFLKPGKEYMLTYKRTLGKDKLRLGLGLHAHSFEDTLVPPFFGISPTEIYLKEKKVLVRIGFERDFFDYKKFKLSAGLDLITNYINFNSTRNQEDFVFFPGFPGPPDVFVSTKLNRNEFVFGLAPLINMTYELNPKISFSSEMNFYFLVSQSKTKTEVFRSNQPAEKNDSKSSASRIDLQPPLAFFMNIKF